MLLQCLLLCPDGGPTQEIHVIGVSVAADFSLLSKNDCYINVKPFFLL